MPTTTPGASVPASSRSGIWRSCRAIRTCFGRLLPPCRTIGFPAFVTAVQALGAAIEIVSDGLGFYVESNLRGLAPQLAGLPIATNDNRLAGPEGMTFPYGHPACFVCGTCKRERVRAHQVDDRVVIFIGDGTSDRYAAHHADIVFAKGPLARWCSEVGHPFRSWATFDQVTAWAIGALASGALPSRAEDLPAWRAEPRSPAERLHLRP